jgi:hypothetical protein
MTRPRFTGALLLAAAACATTPPGAAPAPAAAAADVDLRKVAESYLGALVGTGDQAGRELLLGGATTSSQLYVLENWRIVGEEPARHEEADVELATRLVRELDQASVQAASSLMASRPGDDAASVDIITPDVARELMRPTQESADRLTSAVPVLAAFLYVGQPVYWNAKNASRTTLASARAGTYALDIHTFDVETFEGPRKVQRRFALKLVHFKAPNIDTGWRVLPAADWNAD